jgi:MoxR-like ATPase
MAQTAQPGNRHKLKRACTTCPAFMGSSDQLANIGADTNGPVCGIKMIPLLMPKQDTGAHERVLAHTARNCDKYGTDVKFEPLDFRAAPLLPVGMDTNAAAPGPDDTQAGANCMTCVNHIPQQSVYTETGWMGSICRSTGSLMPANRLKNYATLCGSYVRQAGPQRKNKFATFTFLPTFSNNFGKVDPAAGYRSALEHFVDPREWVNQRPLDSNGRLEASMGRRNIRAWRRVVDPDGYGDDVFLPVYDYEKWIDAERELVPITGDREHPELYADHGNMLYTMAVLWMKLDETPALWGQGGTGKTEFMRHLAWLMCLPFHRINVTSSTEIDDIAGKMLFEEGETRFHYGRLPSAWRKPGIILLDEPNTGPPDVWQFIRPLTDNSQMLVLDQNKAERLQRHQDCFFGMAMNPAWDPRNVGTQTLGDADGSRLMHMFFDYPPRELELEIIQRRCGLDGFELPETLSKALMDVTAELRQLSADGTIHTTWGVRHNIKVSRALKWFPPVKAYRHGVTDSLEPAQMEAVMTVVKSHFEG